jgi:LSD1 subclass zinc finger protein
MYSYMLVNCSKCQTPLQLPPGAESIRCVICQAVTHVAVHSRYVPPPSNPTARPSPSTLAPPSPYNHAPPGPPPNQHGRKKAVIVGISYKYSRHELKGCINDAKCMRHLLMTKFQFPQDSILMLTGMCHGPFQC